MSFVQVLERDYQLVKGWELPVRYRMGKDGGKVEMGG
jgi:hypothetical protein